MFKKGFNNKFNKFKNLNKQQHRKSFALRNQNSFTNFNILANF